MTFDRLVGENVCMITSLPTKRISAISRWKLFIRVLPTRWRRKPAGIEITSLSTYVLVRTRPSNQVICLPAPSIATVLLVVCRRRRPSECHANYKVWIEGRFCPQNCLLRQRPLRDWRDRKNNFKALIYGQISTNPANFVKIGPRYMLR